MAVYKVEICGVNTSKLPLLSNEEKEELFQRILKGDKEARVFPAATKMWMIYFRLAASA